MKNINQQEWRVLVENNPSAVIIDVRKPSEWANGIIENSLLIDVLELKKFEKEISQLVKGKDYYVYCHSGKRSSQACEILESHGIQNTFNLLGGWFAWKGTEVIPTINNFFS